MELERGVEAIGARLDPRITYPCYKSFDELIDVERVKSLDEYNTCRIRLHAKKAQDDYFLNEHRLDTASPHKLGVREFGSAEPSPESHTITSTPIKPQLWQRTEATEEFALLMDFIETLPFKVTPDPLLRDEHSDIASRPAIGSTRASFCASTGRGRRDRRLRS